MKVRIVPLLLASAALSGCGAMTSADDAAGRPTMVASFYPLAWATEQVAGEEYDVINLTSAGGEPHDLELGIRQTAAIEDADLVVYESGFQPAVDSGVENLADGAVVDARSSVPISNGDAHFWLDPLLMADLADAVADQLTEIAPEDAAGFEERAAALRATLIELDAAYSDGLAGCARTDVIVSHAAYGYLERYGPRFAAITTTPDTEPNPGDLARLQELVDREDVTTVFYEPLEGPDAAESVARDLGLETALLDPIEGLSDQTSDEDYLSLMRTNLAALQSANGC